VIKQALVAESAELRWEPGVVDAAVVAVAVAVVELADPVELAVFVAAVVAFDAE